MHFSSAATLVDAHVFHILHATPFKGAALFLHVASKNPLILEDNNRTQLKASEDDLQAYFQSYDKINQESSICLDNVEVRLDFGKEHSIISVEISSKNVVIDVGNKENKLKNFELRVSLQKKDGYFPLANSTYEYLRRMEKNEMMKKNFKSSKVDILNFSRPDKKRSHANEAAGSNPEIESLDSESIMLLHRLLKFTDKEELFRVLLKKPLKDKQSKKAVRLSIIPTDVESETEGFELKKKSYNRNTVLELLGEYEAREARTKE